jgi:hypothetical protein
MVCYAERLKEREIEPLVVQIVNQHQNFGASG